MKASRLFDLIPEALNLDFDAQRLLLADITSLIADPAEQPCSDTDAVSRMYQRLGGWKNLFGYCETLKAGERRKSRPVRIALPY